MKTHGVTIAIMGTLALAGANGSYGPVGR